MHAQAFPVQVGNTLWAVPAMSLPFSLVPSNLPSMPTPLSSWSSSTLPSWPSELFSASRSYPGLTGNTSWGPSACVNPASLPSPTLAHVMHCPCHALPMLSIAHVKHCPCNPSDPCSPSPGPCACLSTALQRLSLNGLNARVSPTWVPCRV